MKTDLLKKELNLNDIVFVVQKNYRNMILAKIIGFTPKQIRVVYSTINGNETYLTNQVVKIREEDFYLYK